MVFNLGRKSFASIFSMVNLQEQADAQGCLVGHSIKDVAWDFNCID